MTFFNMKCNIDQSVSINNTTLKSSTVKLVIRNFYLKRLSSIVCSSLSSPSQLFVMNAGLWYPKPHLLNSKYFFIAKTPSLLKSHRFCWNQCYWQEFLLNSAHSKEMKRTIKAQKLLCLSDFVTVPSIGKRLDMITCFFFFSLGRHKLIKYKQRWSGVNRFRT